MKNNQSRELIPAAGRLAFYCRDTLKLDSKAIRAELHQWAEREGNGLPKSLLSEIAAFVSRAEVAA